MALIHCPECGKEISDQANRCPHCGFPLESETEKKLREAREKDKQSLIKIGAILLVGIAVILGFALWCGR